MRKNNSFRFSLIVFSIVLFTTACSTDPSPKNILSKYLEAYWRGDYNQAYSLLSSKDKAMKSLNTFSSVEGVDNPFKAAMANKVSFHIKDVKIEGDKAEVTVDVTMPDFKPLFGELFSAALAGALSGQRSDKTIDKSLAEKLKGKDLPTTTVTEIYDLMKERDGWKVFLNFEGVAKAEELKKKALGFEKQKKFAEAKATLEEVMKHNPRDKNAPDKIKAIDKKATEYKEKQTYLDKIEVRNVRVEPSYSGRYWTYGELKNRGNRALQKVEITVYCLDKGGNVVHEESYFAVYFSEDISVADKQPLKPNYSKTFKYVIDAAPSDWSKKVKIAVTDIEFQ